MLMRRYGTALLLIAIVACGGGSGSPTAPGTDPGGGPGPGVGDTRVAVSGLFFAKAATGSDGRAFWFVLPTNISNPFVVAHLPCTHSAGDATLLPTIAGILLNSDTASMPRAKFDWSSSDTSVISISGNRTDQFTVSYRKAGTTRLTALYRDGMSVTATFSVQAALAGDGGCDR